MKATHIVMLLMLPLFFLSCSSVNNVLAEFDGKKITQGELEEYLQGKRVSAEKVLASKAAQKNYLRHMAVEMLILEAAEKAGYDQNESTILLLDLAKRNAMASYWARYENNAAPFEAKAIESIVLAFPYDRVKTGKGHKRIPLSKEEAEADKKKKNGFASSVLAELRKGDTVDSVVKKWKKLGLRGGRLGFLTSSYREKEVYKKLEELSSGQWVSAPLITDQAVYLVQPLRKLIITDRNISKIVEDKGERKKTEIRIRRDLAREKRELLRKKSVNKLNLNALDKGDDTPLFSLGDQVLTSKKFLSTLKYLSESREKRGYPPVQNDEKAKRGLLKRMFMEAVFVNDGMKMKIYSADRFKNEWKAYRRSFIAGNYLQDKILTGMAVSEDEIKAEYKKYTKRMAKSRKKKIQPYKKLKSKIAVSLLKRKRQQAGRIWQDKMLTQHSFKIHMKNIQGK